jgi:hypothetical protein
MAVILSGADEDILDAAENIASEIGLRTLGVVQKPLSPEKMTTAIDRFNKIAHTESDRDDFKKSLFRAGSDEFPSVDELREAIENRSLEFLFQPKISLMDNRV